VGFAPDERMLTRLWQRLPWDGLGWSDGPDPVFAELRQWAASEWRRTIPKPLRWLVRPAVRTVWPLAALVRIRAFAARLGLDRAAKGRLFRDCLLSGGDPLDVYVWRTLHGGRHPLPSRSASLLLGRLGDPAGRALLADKLAAAERLAPAGVVFPALHGVYRRGEPVDLAAASAAGGDLFVKPRRGRGGRGAFALTCADGFWRVDGRPVDPSMLYRRLERLSRTDDLLLQERQQARSDMADLVADGRAPVLRLTTARRPGQPPFLHAALLTIAVPGRDPRHFLDGAVHVPVDPDGGRLGRGLCLGAPKDRLASLKWNRAPLAGRPVPDFEAASAMALRAMAALPPLPLVHWDVILTDAGPVVLEGNSGGNWIIASLPGLDGLEACPLHTLLAAWLPPTTGAGRIGRRAVGR